LVAECQRGLPAGDKVVGQHEIDLAQVIDIASFNHGWFILTVGDHQDARWLARASDGIVERRRFKNVRKTGAGREVPKNSFVFGDATRRALFQSVS